MRPTVIKLSDIVQATGIDPAETKAVLRAFCHQPAEVNHDFVLPNSQPGPNFAFKPLIQLDNDRDVLLCPTVCSEAFYEAIATALRRVDKQTEGKIGKATERFVRRQLEERGIAALSGYYEYGGTEYECDLAIETPEVILLVELKKKPLTRRAQAGRNIDILMDLAQSLFDAQIQLNRHELVLRQAGSLTLMNKDGAEARIDLGEKSVAKIAMTLLDYGSFQDRRVLFQIFQTCVGTTFSTDSNAEVDNIKKLNSRARKLAAQYRQLTCLDTAYSQYPNQFVNSWFLSVPQFLVLLSNASSSATLVKELLMTAAVTTHSLDWYQEYAFVRKILSQQQCRN